MSTNKPTNQLLTWYKILGTKLYRIFETTTHFCDYKIPAATAKQTTKAVTSSTKAVAKQTKKAAIKTAATAKSIVAQTIANSGIPTSPPPQTTPKGSRRLSIVMEGKDEENSTLFSSQFRRGSHDSDRSFSEILNTPNRLNGKVFDILTHTKKKRVGTRTHHHIDPTDTSINQR